MKHVLIMEDNVLLALEWQSVFELNGHKVTLTHNGEDAVAHLNETGFDLLITDLFVPNRKGGLYVIGKLLLMKTRTPPTIVVTGQRGYKGGDDETNYFLAQAERLGVSATIEKPFAATELLLIAHKFWTKHPKNLRHL